MTTTTLEGYELIAEGICTFTDSPKTYLGSWYLNDEEGIYYFIFANDSDDEDKEIEIYPVEEENMIYDDHEVIGWYSKTMEEYTFVDLPETDGEVEETPEEGSFWQSLNKGEDNEDEDEDECVEDYNDDEEDDY